MDPYTGYNIIQWFQYADDLLRSKLHHERKKMYEGLVKDLGKDRSLFARCELHGSSKPLHIVIDDFAMFNWLMEKLDDDHDQLISAYFMSAELNMQEKE